LPPYLRTFCPRSTVLRGGGGREAVPLTRLVVLDGLFSEGDEGPVVSTRGRAVQVIPDFDFDQSAGA
jgi:hypothetical protein